MGDTLTTLNAGIEVYYASDHVYDLTAQKRPFFAMLNRNEKAGGTFYAHTLLHGTQQAVNPSFTTAATRATATSTLLKQLNIYHQNMYSIAEVDGRALRRTDGSPEAMLDASKQYVDGAIDALSRRIATQVYRSGWGAVGNIGSISTNTITLANIYDAANFEVGQQVVFSATEAANTLRNTGATTTLTVSALNRSSGIITFSTNVSTVTGATTGDYIFFEGDRQDSATPARVALTGIEGWIPQTAPSSGESFNGIDRSVDAEKLAGSRLDMTNAAPEEVLVEGAGVVATNQGMIDTYLVPPRFFRNLIKAMGARVSYTDVAVNERIGFRTVVITGPTGDIKVVQDFNCPYNRVYGINMEDWELFSNGPAVRLIDDDGNKVLRASDRDAYQVRFAFDGNLVCKRPINQINIKVA